MNTLYIFIIIFIISILLGDIPVRESMRTLRGTNYKYTLTAVKNTFHKHITDKGKKHYTNVHSYITNLKNKWL